jgi:hypothetical protein
MIILEIKPIEIMTKKLLVTFLTIFLFTNSYSQKNLWTSVSKERLSSLEKVKRDSNPTEFLLYSLDFQALKLQLQQAPLDGVSNVIVQFPGADGKMTSFKMYQSEVMHPDLAARYQDIKTYVGQGIEDPTAAIHISTTIFGLHTMTLSGKATTAYIDPYTKDLNNYIVYSKDKLFSTRSFTCNVDKAEGSIDSGLSISTNNLQKATDGKFRTYRLAMACTIEYAAYHITAAGLPGAATTAQKKAAVLAAMVVSMARINGVYMRDMSLTMQLVANNDLVIFVTTDNFSNTNANALINESQSVIDATIGTANYDIGHTVSTGGGGLAQGGCVCIAGSKARGITGSPGPVGDAYDIDFVAHEIGHEFGANHTFSGDATNCGGGNRNNTTAVEPGSGTTIMAYAGICSPQDVALNSDDYFHAVSLAEMFAHITGAGNCVTGVANGNSAPVIPALTNYTIPNGTAFKLIAPTVTDANGDALTYCWEQNINTNSLNQYVSYTPSAIPSTTSTTSSNFRSWPPTTSGTRYCPKYSDVLGGNLTPTWETIPTVARTMDFTLTVRDNRTPNGGQTASKTMKLTYASGTPFAITSQNTDGISWMSNSQQTITWSTGGTSVPATTAVKISLSTDGGLTFPTVLAASTANDGTETITVPAVSATFCRIMIEPLNNIYYAINSKAFAIGYTVVTNCATYTDSAPLTFIDQSPGSYTTRTLNFPAGGTISSVKVFNTITHTYLSDVQTDISSPQNPTTFIKLFNRSCGNISTATTGGPLNLKFSDGAAAIDCASTALQTVIPDGLLSTFNGQNPQGNWTFRVYDNFTGDTGTINTWGIEVCTQTITPLSTQDFGLAEFSLYPNPNKGNFTVKFNSASQNNVGITVHDMRGRIIFDNSYDNTGLFSQNIQLDNAQSGVYLVTVKNGDRKEVKRIVIE